MQVNYPTFSYYFFLQPVTLVLSNQLNKQSTKQPNSETKLYTCPASYYDYYYLLQPVTLVF